MGEISVLGLAALGVWTLLRRARRSASDSLPAADDAGYSGRRTSSKENRREFTPVDISEPTGFPDAEDEALSRQAQRSPQS